MTKYKESDNIATMNTHEIYKSDKPHQHSRLTRRGKVVAGMATAAIAAGGLYQAVENGPGNTEGQTAINRELITKGNTIYDAQIILHTGVHARTSDHIDQGRITIDGAEESNDSFIVGKYNVAVERPLLFKNSDGDQIIAFTKPGIAPDATTTDRAANLVYVNMTKVSQQSPTSIEVMPFDPNRGVGKIPVEYVEVGEKGQYLNEANDQGVQSALYAVELHEMK